MLPIIISSVAGFISLVVLDYLFLAKLAKDFYLHQLASHITVRDGSLVPYLPAVPFVYIVAILAIWIFVLSRVSSMGQAFLYGCTLGFCMYAFYDLTNLATFKDYSLSITLVDILWGTILVGAVTTIMFIVKNAIA